MIKRIVWAATVVLILSGCSVYKTFKTPEPATTDLCGAGVVTQDSLPTVASWREVFADVPLQQLVEKALTANTDLQTARLNIEQAEASLLSSKLAYVPSFAFAPEGSTSKVRNEKAVSTYNLPLTMQWEVDIFGKLRNSKEQARATLLQSTEYAKMVQTQLIASLANHYYTLVMLDEQLRITRMSAENQRENLNVMVAMKEAGMQTETAVNQATADYYGVLSSEKDLVKQFRQVENNISLLLNETPHTIARSSIEETQVVGVDYTAPVPLAALAIRPDVKNAEYALRGSFYDVNIARAAFYPSISLSGSIGWTNNPDVITNPGTMLLSAIGSLAQSLFNRGQNHARLKIAKSQYEQSLLAFEKALLVAGSEVNDALVVCQTSAEKSGFRRKQVKASRKAYENSKELMKHTSTTYLEVLTAQNTLLQSEILFVSDWFEGAQGRINLYKALGGGVE